MKYLIIFFIFFTSISYSGGYEDCCLAGDSTSDVPYFNLNVKVFIGEYGYYPNPVPDNHVETVCGYLNDPDFDVSDKPRGYHSILYEYESGRLYFDYEGVLRTYTSRYETIIENVACSPCEDNEPDKDIDSLIWDLNKTYPIALNDGAACLEMGTGFEDGAQENCEEQGGTFYITTHTHCCTTPYCGFKLNSDDNSTDDNSTDSNDDNSTDDNSTDSNDDNSNDDNSTDTNDDISSDCPNGVDASGVCCSPGEFVCNGYCQLNAVPCDGSPDTNDSDPNGSGDDPCNYAPYYNDIPLQGKMPTLSSCFDDAKLFGNIACNGNPEDAHFEINDDCELGGCYYSVWSHNPTGCDDNTTSGGDDSNTTTDSLDDNSTDDNSTSGDSNVTALIDLDPTNKKLDTINNTLKSQTSKLSSLLAGLDSTAGGIKNSVDTGVVTLSHVLNNMNQSLGDKLNNIKESIDDKNLSVVVNVDKSNDVNISIDLNETNSLLTQEVNNTNQIKNALSFDKKSVDDAVQPYTDSLNNAKNVFNDALSTFAQSKADIEAIVNGATAPTVSYSGNCVLSTSVFSGGTFTIDLSVLADFRPPVQFVLNLILLYLSLRFYVIIARDIVSYIAGGN